MKKLLLLLLISLCGFAWRSDDLIKMLGLVHLAHNPEAAVATLQTGTLPAPRGMSLTEYAELAKTDPDAYQKLFASHLQAEERSEIDKLMNFFSTLKYE